MHVILVFTGYDSELFEAHRTHLSDRLSRIDPDGRQVPVATSNRAETL